MSARFNKIFLIIICAVAVFNIFFPRVGHAPYKIQVLDAYGGKDPSLRVYNNRNKTEFLDYYTTPKLKYLRIYNQEIWGFCILRKGLSISKEKVDFHFVKTQGECESESNIKKYNKDHSPLTLKFSRFMISLLLLLGIYLLTLGVKKFSTMGREYWIVPIVVLFTLIVWLSISWPANFDDDLNFILYEINNYLYSSWFGYNFYAIFLGLVEFYDHIGIFPIFTSFVVFILFFYFAKVGKMLNHPRLISWWYAGLLLLPTIGLQVTFISRDVLSSIMLICLALSCYFFPRKSQSLNSKLSFIIFISFLSVLAISLRTDTILSVGILFIYIMSFVLRGKKERGLIIAVFLGFLFLHKVATSYFTPYAKDARNTKLAASISHTVGEMITRGYSSDNLERDKEILSRYYHLDKIRRMHKDNDIPAFHHGGVKYEAVKDISDLVKVYIKMIVNNPLLYLEGRLKLLNYSFGAVVGKTFFIANDMRYIPHKTGKIYQFVFDHNMYSYGIPEKNSIRNKFDDIIGTSLIYKAIHVIYIPFLALIICLCLFKKTPITAMAASILLVKMVPFFFLAPAGQFKYYLDIYWGGLLLVPLLYAEYRKNTNSDN